MPDHDQLLKKIYSETASLIADCSLRGEFDNEHMCFLLNLLELSIVKKKHPQLFTLLNKWMDAYTSNENDRIIEATLLAMDFDDNKNMEENMGIIADLLNIGSKV